MHHLVVYLFCLVTSLHTVFAQGITPYLGSIILWANPSVIPTGYLPCDGRSLSIAQNTALFSLLGVTYGGDGRTNFNIPNLVNVFPLGAGSGTSVGQKGGSNGPFSVAGTATGSVTLDQTMLPPHTHNAVFTGQQSTNNFNIPINVGTSPGSLTPQADGFLSLGSDTGSGQAAIFQPQSSSASKVILNGGSGTINTTPQGQVAVSSTGQGQPVPLNLQVKGTVNTAQPPFLALTYLIAVQGIYPTSG